MRPFRLALCFAIAMGGFAKIVEAQEPTLTLEEINAAQFEEGQAIPEEQSAIMVKLQVLLDRANVSPGVIDGYQGENTNKALRIYEQREGLEVDGQLDAEVWSRLTRDNVPAMTRYALSEDDVDGPFVDSVPDDYRKMSEMERLAYTGPAEMLAEKFHMDIDLFNKLNADAELNAAGAEIVVTQVGEPMSGKITRIEVDKQVGQIRGYDGNNSMVTAYPATIGSQELPSPDGTHEVKAIAMDAAYYYRPDVNFKADGVEEQLTLPPGPNNPIGTVWIDLTEPTYGIHGTPEPAIIDKSYSHGCVRLTNWDVEELAEMIEPGVKVEFLQ